MIPSCGIPSGTREGKIKGHLPRKLKLRHVERETKKEKRTGEKRGR